MRPLRLLAPLAAVAAALLLAAGSGLSGALSRAVDDLRTRLSVESYEGPIVLVVIDQPSLRELPGWPWPRSRHALLVDRLTAAGATVIGFDIDFSSSGDPREDEAFARAVAASGRVVLGAFKEEQTVEGFRMEYAGLPVSPLAEAGAAIGSILMPVDADGSIRRATLEDSINGRPVRAFAVEVARLHAGLPADVLLAKVPDARGGLVIDYTAGRPPTYAYADVLAGRVPVAALAGRAALVGASALELQDLRATPIGRLTPGVEVQGYAVHTLLGGGGLRPLPMPLAAGLALLLAAVSLGATRGRGRIAGLVIASLPAVAGVPAAAALAAMGPLLVPAGPLLVAGWTAAVAHGLAEWAETRQELGRVRRRLTALADFGRAASPARGIEQSVEMILEVVREMIGLERVAVELPDGRAIAPPRAEIAVEAAAREVAIPIVTAGGRTGRLLAGVRPGRDLGVDERALLEAIAARIAVDSENRDLIADLKAVHLSVVHSLAVAIEMRNAYTGQHCEGVARRAAAIAETFGLDREAVERIRIGGLLHDIGKIGVPEPILLKPGRFTPDEYEVMKQHSAIGYKIIASLPFPEEVKEYVRHHHERFDGKGYPDGLSGERLSLGARIVSVADCYEALTTDRPYRARVAPADAMAYIRRQAGSFYDPAVVGRLERVLRADGLDLEGPVEEVASWHR